MPRTGLGPVSLDVCDLETILQGIREIVKARTPSQIVTLNALMFNAALRDKVLRDSICKSSLIIPDSSGITWAARFLGNPDVKQLAGIDLMGRICALSAESGFSVFLLGSRPGVAGDAAQNLSKLYPGLKITGVHHGYFRDDEENIIFSRITEISPDILFVGLEVPRQELWIAKNLSRLKVPVVMGIGGSFDVISKRLKRAPGWMRGMYLEWFFRFLQQPWRIKRLADLPFFVTNIISLRIGKSPSAF